MNVPNHEKKTFKDMTPEERSAIVEAKLREGCEIFSCERWGDSASSGVAFDGIYRTRPRQLVIPWDVIKPEYKWAAMDECGRVFLYEEKPSLVRYKNKCFDDRSEHYGWTGGGGFLPCCLNIDTTGIDWRESLVQRPE